MDAKELRLKNPIELERLVLELRAKLHGLRSRVATNQQTKVRDLRVMRKDLARALSVQAAAKRP
jgi:ribosomal protein L29